MSIEIEITEIALSAAKGLLTKLKNEDYMQVFHVEFIKRTNGEYRKMNCRYGVTKALAGGQKAFNDEDYQLKTVYDMDKAGYRSIALEGLVKFKIKGKVYIVIENKDQLPKE